MTLDLWIDHEALKVLSTWSDRTIQRKCRQGEIMRRYLRARLRNGRNIPEYSVSSLSGNLQTKILQQMLKRVQP